MKSVLGCAGASFLLATVAALLVVLSGPFVGRLRAVVQQALPGQYRLIIAVVVATAVVAAVARGLVVIRTRRRLRYGLMAAAVLSGAAYARGTRTGNLDVDLVELFHFVEYGLLAFLFYRVWRRRDDLRTLVYPCLAVLTAGIADEAFQWWVPDRVGELHDVMLNGAAGICGLVFSVGLDPPARVGRVEDRRGRAWLATACALVILLTALFLRTIHVGYEVRNDVASTFRSGFRAEDLRTAAVDRAARWPSEPPPDPPSRVSREDRYLAEGRWHLQLRNEASTAGDPWVAWKENLILETYFAPVLDLPAFRARWRPEQRADAAARVGDDWRPYASTAHPYPIYVWNVASFWMATAAVMALVFSACIAVGGRGGPAGA